MIPARQSSSPTRLAVHYYPAQKLPVQREPLVLLHGWGCDSQTWQPLLHDLQQFGDLYAIDLPGFGGSESIPFAGLDTVLDLLAQQLPARAVLMGWSLGGMLAVALAARAPEKVSRVITLATNVKFVASADYPAAMPRAINRNFNQQFAADPHQTLKLFTGLLAQGDARERSLLKTLRGIKTGEPNTAWQDALLLLAQLDNRTAFAQLSQPGLHILTEADALVPVSAADELRKLNPHQHIEVLSDSAHAIHWSQPHQVVQLINIFLQPTPGVLDKCKVAQSFSRAARTYDAVAKLQRDVGQHLLQQLPKHLVPHRVIDLGCGTGFFSQQLRQQFPPAELIGVDIAQGMLDFARETHGDLATWLCCDAEQLSLADASVELIFSSLAIQWCTDTDRLFAEIRRVLTPGGVALLATLGPATLHELRHAWQQVDGYVHVNRFETAENLQASIAASDLVLADWQTEQRELHYDRLVDLTRELKALGAHNINAGKPGGLTGRKKIEAFKQAYEQFRRDDALPASYELFYVLVQAPWATSEN
ncbi:malonyl-ACP O-methyltransferase BioC [Cellvibrio sp. PSBB006]|uniref:malonyl-ACP O-methyltransferase BioC n=1 Tax=Cellvibrio sp. PSBB006 TaxID=1987723 RepID=UPI001E5A9CBD|nr:malonyl-ACP O-methyltransferase BioC [Cellvibrio sp. PSBB006]